MSKYVRKPATVEASQVSNDLTVGGVTVPAGHWVVIHDDGHITSATDTDFTAEYELAPEPIPVPDGLPPASVTEPGADTPA